jgi:hypothetical protein
MDNYIQLKISTLRDILESAEANHREHKNTLPVIRIYKRADRQHPEIEDKYETKILLGENADA